MTRSIGRELGRAVACLSIGAALSAGAPAAAGQTVYADFNADGFSDLAVSAYGDNPSGMNDAGTVTVLYGSPSGPSAAGSQYWHQDSAGVLDSAETGDNFGSSLAAGDFNGDGYADLAIGVGFESIVAAPGEGAVQVLYGSASGLTATGNQLWHQDVTGVLGVAQSEDQFGASLASGDFNDDGFADLAVGVPWDDGRFLGAVNVLFGSASGLAVGGNQYWAPQRFAEFGRDLSVGDFNGDGHGDLAVGAPLDSVSGIPLAGTVSVAYGSTSGLDIGGAQLWHQDSPGVADSAEDGDQFGSAVASSDFNGDAIADLMMGVPSEDLGTTFDAGAFHVLYGSASGLGTVNSQFWSQGSLGIRGELESGDLFGSNAVAADFDADGLADLAVTAFTETVSSKPDAGAVNVLYGSAAGLSASGSQFWHQDVAGVRGNVAAGDMFGTPLSAADFDGDGRADLAAGVSGETVGGAASAGAVSVLFGSAGGLTAAGNQLWSQNSEGVSGTAAASNFFAGVCNR